MNIVYDAIQSLLPSRRTQSGWQTLNCPACHHIGPHKPDKKKRGGFILEGSSLTYNCFNCQLSTRYDQGGVLYPKMRNLLTWMGMGQDDLQKLSFEANSIRAGYYKQILIKTQPLPNGARSIFDWANDNCVDPDYIAVAGELLDMPIERLKDIYWTPDTSSNADMNRRWIDPIRDKGELLGWAALSIDNEGEEPIWSDPNIAFVGVEED